MAFDKKAYDTEYKKKHFKRVPLDMQHSEYDRIKAHTAKTGESVNGFIKRAISETIISDEQKTE